MRLCVLKFGGTCLATELDRERSADLCASELEKFEKVVVVVSAMGRKGDPYSTDTLLEMVRNPEPGEKSCLLACGEIISAALFADMLRDKGIPAVSITGWNAGIRTGNKNYGAELQKVEKEYLESALAEFPCVVVAGFQGMNDSGRVSVLGRGGSDVTAAAIAAAMDADELVLFKKVDSIFTADPARVSGAVKVERISVEDLRQMGWEGAGVLHPRASEIAGAAGMPMKIKSLDTGHVVTKVEPYVIRSGRYITGVVSGPDVARFLVLGDGEEPGKFYSGVFGMVASAGVSMDMFSVMEGRMMFTVSLADVDTTAGVLDDSGLEYSVLSPCVKVSIVGAGMHGMHGVMARFSSALYGAGIEMLQTVDSHATISALVRLERRDDALRALHREFLET